MDKSWEDLSTTEKQETRFQKWLSPGAVQFESPEAKASYQRKVTRIKDAVQLNRTPDRVPIYPNYTFLPVYIFGSTPGEVMYDTKKLVSLWKRFIEEFDMDCYVSPMSVFSGRPLEILDYNLYQWPGHGVSKTSTYQCVEDEYMKAIEYEHLIDDPSDFWLRKYLPRVFGALEPLGNLSPLTDILELPCLGPQLMGYGLPEVQKAFKALLEAGEKVFEWAQDIEAFEMEVQQKGYPNEAGGFSKAPFDVLGDTLRGTRAIMTDLYRQPEMVLKALERITPMMIKMGISGPEATGNPIVFIPLHKGADGFMSDEQFRTFYWPTLKEVVLGLIHEGCVPLLFAEGGYHSRLTHIKELPMGSCIWLFDRTDMLKAKKALGDRACIAGNVPSGMLVTGSPDQVRDHCRHLIDGAGRNGGFMLSSGTALDEGKAETLHAMIRVAKEYGVYG